MFLASLSLLGYFFWNRWLCIPSEPGEKRKDRNGVIEKNLLSTIIPYVSQTGSIKYVPKGVTGCPPLSVKAIKHHRMSITNVKAFAGKDYITFDGETIKKEVKKFETGAGVSIRVKRGEWTYAVSWCTILRSKALFKRKLMILGFGIL